MGIEGVWLWVILALCGVFPIVFTSMVMSAANKQEKKH